MEKRMRIGYIQTSPEFGNREKNFKEVRALTRGVRADLLVLPELFATGYAFTSGEEARELAEGSDGPTAGFLMELSKKTGAAVAAGFPELHGNAVYNAAMLVHRGRVLGVYRKIHLFNREKLWFAPGDKKPGVFNVDGITIGMMICFDWIFPETARSLALQGADIIAHPSNLVLPYCQKAMVTRCLENRVFAITANRIGRETRGSDDFTFTGRSQATSPEGEVLFSGPENGAHAGIVEVDPLTARDKTLNPYNHLLGDRRPELY